MLLWLANVGIGIGIGIAIGLCPATAPIAIPIPIPNSSASQFYFQSSLPCAGAHPMTHENILQGLCGTGILPVAARLFSDERTPGSPCHKNPPIRS
jgi:hypothetical protein